MKIGAFAKQYDPKRERRARRNCWLCVFLLLLLLVGACSFLTISGHAATFTEVMK